MEGMDRRGKRKEGRGKGWEREKRDNPEITRTVRYVLHFQLPSQRRSDRFFMSRISWRGFFLLRGILWLNA